MDKRTTGANDLQLERSRSAKRVLRGPFRPLMRPGCRRCATTTHRSWRAIPPAHRPSRSQPGSPPPSGRRLPAERRAGCCCRAWREQQRSSLCCGWPAPSVVPSDPDTAGGPDVITTRAGPQAAPRRSCCIESAMAGPSRSPTGRKPARAIFAAGLCAGPGSLWRALVDRWPRWRHRSLSGRQPRDSSLFPGPVMPPKSSAEVLVTREIRLPQAFRLDDAPGFERFFLITAEEAHADSLKLSEIVAAARRLAADPAAPSTSPGCRACRLSLGSAR